MKKTILIFIISLTLCGCGFKPGNYNTQIVIDNYEKAPRKITVILNDYLTEELNQENQPERYVLNLKLLKTTDSFETQSNTVNLRTRVTLTVNYTLRDLHNNKTIIEDKIIAIDSYEESSSPYGTLVSSEEIAAKMAKSIAREIRLRIASKI